MFSVIRLGLAPPWNNTFRSDSTKRRDPGVNRCASATGIFAPLQVEKTISGLCSWNSRRKGIQAFHNRDAFRETIGTSSGTSPSSSPSLRIRTSDGSNLSRSRCCKRVTVTRSAPPCPRVGRTTISRGLELKDISPTPHILMFTACVWNDQPQDRVHVDRSHP